MFAVIYQGYVKKGMDNQYKMAWHEVASYFIERRGAFGSRLHQTKEGLWIAYSCWPNKETRDKSWPGDHAPSTELPNSIRKAILTIKDSLDQERNERERVQLETCMEVIDDLLCEVKPKLAMSKL